MLVAAAVVPGAPALVPELVGSAASDTEEVRCAAARAVGSVLDRLTGPGGVPIGRLVVLASAPAGAEAGSRSYDIGGEVVDDSFGPELRLPSLPGARPPLPVSGAESGSADGSAGESLVPTPLLVARWLCGQVAADRTGAEELWAEALWLTVTPEAAADYGRSLDHDLAPVGLVVVADGAAPHGPADPAAEVPRVVAYDEAVAKTLESGDPGAVAALDVELGLELAAEGAGLWPALAAASQGAAWRADLLWRGSPYGVAWFVAHWQRAPA